MTSASHGTSTLVPGKLPSTHRVLCGIDGSPSAVVAAQQALAVVAPDGRVRFFCVRSETGVGPTHMTTISRERTESAMKEAIDLAAEAGIDASGDVVESDYGARTLLAEAKAADLIVVGSHGVSRGGGIVLGSTASLLAHRAPRPVLIARRPPDGVGFLERILVASDGSRHAGRAVAFAAALAQRHRADVWLLGVDGHGRAHRLAPHTAQLAAILGRPPLSLERSGHPHDEIVAAARATRASLVVVGARGLTGVQALGSVSERVVHEAPCSVLVARR